MSRPTAVGVHIFAGGFTLGVRRHFKVLGQCEDKPHYAGALCRANLPRLRIWEGYDEWPGPELRGRVDLVYGNPPCALWSAGAYGLRRNLGPWRSDPRLQMLLAQFELLERWRPRAWVWESVLGAFRSGRSLVDELTEAASKLGYAVTYVLHDAQRLGVPQRRERFFFVAHDVAIDWLRGFREPVTVREALRGVRACHRLGPRPNDLLLELYDRAGPGNSLRRFMRAEDHSRYGRPSTMERRLPTDRPGHTIVGFKTWHPTKPRRISATECAALMGFPRGWKWEGIGGSNGPHDLITRGVCPPVGAWLAGRVAAGLRRDLGAGAGVVTVVDVRDPERATTEVLRGGVPLDL